jgi:hypothetical protein
VGDRHSQLLKNAVQKAMVENGLDNKIQKKEVKVRQKKKRDTAIRHLAIFVQTFPNLRDAFNDLKNAFK